MENWTFKGTSIDSQPFFINGLNIWDHSWLNTGLYVKVKDPLYGKEFQFLVYEIHWEGKVVRFATGEFSNTVFGVYTEG